MTILAFKASQKSSEWNCVVKSDAFFWERLGIQKIEPYSHKTKNADPTIKYNEKAEKKSVPRTRDTTNGKIRPESDFKEKDKNEYNALTMLGDI